jgi:metalloendopeptidase OMA1, mitochondrial
MKFVQTRPPADSAGSPRRLALPTLPRFGALAWVAILAVLTWPLAVSTIGCAPQGQGPGHRAQFLALTPQQELEIGRQASQEILQKVRTVRGGTAVERVRNVSDRIAKAVQIEPLDREINLHVADVPFEWEYHVIDGDQINAFCLPGGKIFVFTGLLGVVQNDDQLAAVIAHEVAHALAHHVSERIARHEHSGGGLFSLGFDREQESEADHIGIFLMTFAGYDPEQVIAFWQEMQSLGSRSIHLPEILSDHPSDARRLGQIKQWAPMASAAKQAYDSGRILPSRN